jgi:hypothetical protein
MAVNNPSIVPAFSVDYYEKSSISYENSNEFDIPDLI